MKYCFPISGDLKWFRLSVTLSLNSRQCTWGDKWREELRFCVAFAEKKKRCRDIRTRLAEKKRSWREIQRRGEIGAKCGHPTPFYETHRLDFIVIVGPFTSSSFSLLSNSSPLFLFGVDFHFVLVNKWQRWEKEGRIEVDGRDYLVNCGSSCDNNTTRACDNCQSRRWWLPI